MARYARGQHQIYALGLLLHADFNPHPSFPVAPSTTSILVQTCHTLVHLSFPLKALNECVVTSEGVRDLFNLIRPEDPCFASAFYEGVIKTQTKQTALHLGAQGAGASLRLQGSRLIRRSPSTTLILILMHTHPPAVSIGLF